MAIIKDGVLIKAEDSDIINGVFTAPPEVRVIGPRAFENTDSLLEVHLPGNVVGIGKYAFYCCRNLKCVTSTNNLLIVGECAFWDCGTLISFLVDDFDNYQEEESFKCTGSEFIKLFGYYETLSKDYEKVKSVENSISNGSNLDWLEVANLYDKYSLYSGMYCSSFIFCYKIETFQIPNKMNVLGERFLEHDKLFIIADLGNIVHFYYNPNKSAYGNLNLLKKAQDFYNQVMKNKISVKHNLKKLELSQVPERTGLIRGLFSKNKSVVIEKKTPEKKLDNQDLSAEQLELLLESKITMLEAIEPDTALHFRNKLNEIYEKSKGLETGYSRHYEISCLYDTLSRVISIVQTKNIKRLINKDNIDEAVFKKYADILIDSKDHLTDIGKLLNNSDVYKRLRLSLYYTLYEMIKMEMANFGRNELFDKMSKADRMLLLGFFAKDITSNEELVVESLNLTDLDLDKIKKLLISQGINITYISKVEPKPTTFVRLDGSRTVILEKSEAISVPFPIIKS